MSTCNNKLRNNKYLERARNRIQSCDQHNAALSFTSGLSKHLHTLKKPHMHRVLLDGFKLGHLWSHVPWAVAQELSTQEHSICLCVHFTSVHLVVYWEHHTIMHMFCMQHMGSIMLSAVSDSPGGPQGSLRELTCLSTRPAGILWRHLSFNQSQSGNLKVTFCSNPMSFLRFWNLIL